MPPIPSHAQHLSQYLRDAMGPGASDINNMRLDFYQGQDAGGHPLGSFETYHGIQGTLSHIPSGDQMAPAGAGANPLIPFTLRHDEDSGSFFINGNRIMSGPGQNDTLRLIANTMVQTYRQAVAGNMDSSQATRLFSENIQAFKGSYVDPNARMTPGAMAKIGSEAYFGASFNPETFSEDSGPFQINGQHYFSRTQKMHGPSVEGMYPSLEGSMWSMNAGGDVSFVNPKAALDPNTYDVMEAKASKFIKAAQKTGLGDIGRLLDPVSGREIQSNEAHGYRTDPLTGGIIRDAGYNLNVFIPVGGGGLPEGQVAQYSPFDFQIDRTAVVRGNRGELSGLYNQLPDSVLGRYQDIQGLDRSTGGWDRTEIAKDRAQMVSAPLGDTAYVPITMTISSGGETAFGHSGMKGFAVPAISGAYGAPDNSDYAMAANSIKNPIAFANSSISGNINFLLSQGKSLQEAVGMLGLGNIYNTEPARGPLGYDQSNIVNYGAIQQAYVNTIIAPWNQVPGGVMARLNTNVGRFGAWQWGQPALPAEDAPKLASMDPAFYNRTVDYSASRRDPYAEIMNSGIAMSNPNQSGFIAREGIPLENIASELAGSLSYHTTGTPSTNAIIAGLGEVLGANGLSGTAPILASANVRNPDGSLSMATLRLPSHRNFTWANGKSGLSGMDETGGPDEGSDWNDLGAGVSEYNNLATRIIQQKMYGSEINLDDATRYKELSEKLSYSKGIVKNAQRMYLPGSAGGPVFGDSSIERNAVALGDKQIAKVFGITETDTQFNVKLDAAKKLLDGGNESAYYMLYPHLSQNKMLRLRATPMSSVTDLSVANTPYGIGVNPMTQSQLDKDFDVDAGLVAVSSQYEWDATSQTYKVSQAGKPPMTTAELDRRKANMMTVGQGEAEWRKWDEDRLKYDSQSKLQGFLSNLMPEHFGMISSSEIQATYSKKIETGWDMGWSYNMARKAMAISGFNEMSARMYEPYYQAALDSMDLADRPQAGVNILKSLQASTAGFKSGESQEGDAILGHYNMANRGVAAQPGLNKAMADIITRLWSSGNVTEDGSLDPGFLKNLFPGVDPSLMAGFDRLMTSKLASGPSMAATKLMGPTPWDDAATLGGPALALRADISRRWNQKNIAGVQTGKAMGPEDIAYAEMGNASDKLVQVLSGKFDNQQGMIDAFQGALVQDEPGSEGGIPFGSYMSRVWSSIGFADQQGNPKFKALSGFSKYLGFAVPGNEPEKFTNPATGTGVYLSARIQPEEAKLLRGLEAIGRSSPDQAKEISNWLGSQADSANVSGLHIYTNPAITNQAGSDPEWLKMAFQFAMNAQAQMGDERIRSNLNMPAPQADAVMQAITNVTKGTFVNQARLQDITGLMPQNEIMDSIMRVQGGMSHGVNANQVGTFQGALAQLATFSNMQTRRMSNQEFRQSLGGSAARFGANADEAYENIAGLMDVAGQSPVSDLKNGIRYDGPMSYSAGASAIASAPPDPQQIELTTRAFSGLGDVVAKLEPLTNQLAKSHGDLAKNLQEQIAPLEKAKDAFLGAIRGVNGMDQQAEALSGGNANNKAMAMRALVANRTMDISQAETMFGDATAPSPKSGGVGGFLDDLSQGKNGLGRFLRSGQVMNGIQLFALSRLDKAFTDPAIGSTLAGAQTEAGYEGVLAQAGYGGSTPSISMQSAGAYGALQSAMQRQNAATWSPIVGGAANLFSGGAGGAASIGLTAGAGALLGGYLGFTVGGPVGALAGAGIGGIGTAVAGILSRQQYLADNPSFAASDAWNSFAGNAQNYQQIAVEGPNGQLTWHDPGNRGVDVGGGPMAGVPNSKTRLTQQQMDQYALGYSIDSAARAGLPRSQMDTLNPQSKLEATNEFVQGYVKQGYSPQLVGQVAQQNGMYFGGGNQNVQALLTMGMSGVNMDAGTQLMASLNGGSFTGYGSQMLPYAGNPGGFQNGMMGLQSPFSQALSSMGQGLSFAQGEQFQGLGRPQQDLMTSIASRQGDVFNSSMVRGLNQPGNSAMISELLKRGDPHSIALAQQMSFAAQQSGSVGVSAYDSMLGYGSTSTQAAIAGNSMMSYSPVVGGAAQNLTSSMVGLGLSANDAGSVMVQAAGLGTGGMRVMGNAIGGDPNAMSLMGQVVGDNSMITRETGAYGGNQGLPLFTSTLGYGSSSPQQTMQRMFGPLLGNVVTPAVQNAMLNGGPNLTGQSYGGLWGAQDYFQQQSWNLQLGSIGIAAGNTQRDISFATGQGLSGYTNMFSGQPFQEGQGSWALEDQQVALQREQQKAQVGWQLQNNAMQTSQYLETNAFNVGVRNQQYQWQQEDFTVQHDTTMLQRDWTQQDWSYDKNVNARNYGWQQEDFDTNIRRSQGFDRKQLEKEKARSTVAYDTDLTHENTTEDRQKQLWKLQDQQFDKEIKRAQEVYDTDMKRFDMEKKQFLDRQAADAAHAGQQLAWIDEQSKLEDAQRELQRTQYKLGKDSELASLGNQAAAIKNDQTRYAVEQSISREQEKATDALTARFATEVGFYNSVGDWFVKMKAFLEAGATGSAPHMDAPSVVQPNSASNDSGGQGTTGAPGTGATGAAVGYQGLPRDLRVGEFGPEVVHNNGKWMTVTPSLPAFDANFHRGNSQATGQGDVYVLLDGEQIAAKLVTRNAKRLNHDRKR